MHQRNVQKSNLNPKKKYHNSIQITTNFNKKKHTSNQIIVSIQSKYYTK
jgi:hypothetical protein